MPFKSQERFAFGDAPSAGRIGAVYGVLDNSGAVVYVGQTKNLGKRFSRHLSNKEHCMHAHSPSSVVIERVNKKKRRREREAELIAEIRPQCN